MYHVIKQYTRSLALILFLGAGLVFMATPAQSQGIQPGVRAGVDFMSVSGDGTDDAGSRTGFLIGGFATVDFGSPVLLQPELMYIQKGASSEESQSLPGGGEATITSTTALNYIDIPVLAKYQIPAGGFSPSLFAGPSLGFNIGATSETECSGIDSDQVRDAVGCGESTDVSDSISSTDFGLILGAGADFGLGAGTVTLDFRYNLGLSNILDVDADVSQNNQGFMVTAGFAF